MWIFLLFLLFTAELQYQAKSFGLFFNGEMTTDSRTAEHNNLWTSRPGKCLSSRKSFDLKILTSVVSPVSSTVVSSIVVMSCVSSTVASAAVAVVSAVGSAENWSQRGEIIWDLFVLADRNSK